MKSQDLKYTVQNTLALCRFYKETYQTSPFLSAFKTYESIEAAGSYFEKYAKLLVEKLIATSDETWDNQIVEFQLAGNKLFAFPMTNMFWMFMFDIIHHRGQLSTKYRHMGVRKPLIFGPTAENIEAMAAAQN